MGNTAGMAYEPTTIKQSKGLGKKAVYREMEHIGTPSILWYLAKRHKTGLLATWAVTLTAYQLAPWAPDVLLSLAK